MSNIKFCGKTEMTLLARINDFVQADALYISILQLYDIIDIMVCILCSVLNIYNTQIFASRIFGFTQ